MAARQDEIIRELEDGFVVAWDTTDVPEEVREQFRRATQSQIDILVQVLGESGIAEAIAVEAKVAGTVAARSKKRRRAKR